MRKSRTDVIDVHERRRVVELLRRILDPELGVNIVDLGLIYGIRIDEDEVRVEMTMTTPACPLASYLRDNIRSVLQNHAPEKTVTVDVIWEPPWAPSHMSEAAYLLLGGK